MWWEKGEASTVECYKGVKFQYVKKAASFDFDKRLYYLNRWAHLFFELGLAPLHSGGAAGNHSYRTAKESCIITKSGMAPRREPVVEQYVALLGYDEEKRIIYAGRSHPSSESVLHYRIYQNFPGVQSVMHGHSRLFLQYAQALHLPVTEALHPYGTPELAESALELLDGNNRCIILKDHGFVVVGESIQMAGKLVLEKYIDLLKMLRAERGVLRK